MSQQRLLFKPPVEPMPVCPSCGYTPAQEATGTQAEKAAAHPSRLWMWIDMPRTFEEALDFFEVAGADDGNVFCPKCCCEFNPDTCAIATEEPSP